MATASMNWFWRVVPAFGSLRGYRARDAKADFVAGLTVAAVALPQAMAYALVVGLPVEYGLYTAIVMTAIGAIFDSSRQLINGPTNAVSIALLTVITVVDPDQKVQAAISLAFLVGMVQLGITLFRMGDLARYISHSVIIGFTVGAGSLLVLDQLKNLLGMRAVGDPHAHFVVRFVRSLAEGGGVQGETAAIGLGTVALLLAMRWIKHKIGWRLFPELLVVVLLMSALVGMFDLEQRGVRVVGAIPAKLPSFAPPVVDFDIARQYATGALAIAVLGLLEAIAMAKAIAAQTRQKLDVNQQCLSEAVANIGGSFFHCFPGSGSLTRSAINQHAGASTQWSGVWSAAAVALIVLLFAPYAQFIPRAALAGILMVTAFRMVDWHALVYHWRATRFDAAIIAATAISAVAISVEFCVLIGVLMSFMLTVPRAGRMLLTEFVITDDGEVHERLPGDEPCDRILIFGFEGELFFGAASELETHFQEIRRRVTDQTEFVLLRVKRTRNPDAVGMTIIEQNIAALEARGVKVLLCGVRAEFQQKLERTKMDERLRGQVFLEQPVRQTSTLHAIQFAYQHLSNPCDRCPRRDESKRNQPMYYAV